MVETSGTAVASDAIVMWNARRNNSVGMAYSALSFLSLGIAVSQTASWICVDSEPLELSPVCSFIAPHSSSTKAVQVCAPTEYAEALERRSHGLDRQLFRPRESVNLKDGRDLDRGVSTWCNLNPIALGLEETSATPRQRQAPLETEGSACALQTALNVITSSAVRCGALQQCSLDLHRWELSTP